MQDSCDAHDILVCPVDGAVLSMEDGWLMRNCGRRYPVVQGVPVLLRTDYQLYGQIGRILLTLSERLRKVSRVFPPSRYRADNVYLFGTKQRSH